MTERIFNLFLWIENNYIVEIGAKYHEQKGSDKQKLKFLQNQAEKDINSAKRFEVPSRYVLIDTSDNQIQQKNAMRYESYLQLSNMGRHLEVFEEIFEHYNAPDNPLVCITPIIDGKPKIDKIVLF
jgi:hypothetical protein